jgi:hypothetical protein
VKPGGRNDWARCGDIREAIVEKLPIFLHEFDEQRLKNPSLHLSWEQQSPRFLVKCCRDLSVKKMLDPNYCVTHEPRKDDHVSAEITTDANSSVVTLWLKKAEQVDMYE